MADRAISELSPVTTVTSADSFVLEQNNRAMRLTGQVLLNWLVGAMDGHGGINNIAKTGTSGLTDTYTITYADQTTTTYTIVNAKSIASITKTGTSGLTDTYNITYNDGTHETFSINNGRGISTVQKSTSGLTDTYTINFNDNTNYAFDVDNGISITSVEKTATAGLVDTYTIHFNNNSFTTFTVTNGEKGDKGDNAYVHIRYSTNEPTHDSDMHTTPDNWIGIYSGMSATAPTVYTDYSWFQIKGQKGDKGDNVTIDRTTTQYQVGDDGTTVPTTWQDTLPTVPQGKYLWVNNTIYFLPSGQISFYTPVRNGIDGSGSVSTVNNLSPDANGNVNTTAYESLTLTQLLALGGS